MLTSSTQLQNRSFHVVGRTRTSTKCQKMKNARAKRAKILFSIVKYANLSGFCCRRRGSCLSSLLILKLVKNSWREKQIKLRYNYNNIDNEFKNLPENSNNLSYLFLKVPSDFNYNKTNISLNITNYN